MAISKHLWQSTRCVKCGRRLLITDELDGELLCPSCGTVAKDRTEELVGRSCNGDLRSGGGGSGPPTSLTIHDMGLATRIANSVTDASGRPIPGSMRALASRLRTWDNRSQVHSGTDRSLQKAFDELDRIASRLSLPDATVERAAYIYRKALRRSMIRGRPSSIIVAACLYASCRESQIPRTLKDVAVAADIPARQLARYYRLVLTEIDIRMPIPDPSRCIAVIASRVQLNERVRRKALELLQRVKELNLATGKGPMGLAATALYVACALEGDDTTQRELADAAMVTEVTLRNRYRDLKLCLGI